MASDGYVLVQRRSDGKWIVGDTGDGVMEWSMGRDAARRFQSQTEFRRWHQIEFGRHWTWSGEMRFVRVRPRKEAA